MKPDAIIPTKPVTSAVSRNTAKVKQTFHQMVNPAHKPTLKPGEGNVIDIDLNEVLNNTIQIGLNPFSGKASRVSSFFLDTIV